MGEESDADWQEGLIEWGREIMNRMMEDAIYGARRPQATAAKSFGEITINDFREAMAKAMPPMSRPFREIVCNERMRADARLVHTEITKGSPVNMFGNVPVRYSEAVPDGYLVLTDGAKIVAVIGPEKPK